MGSEKTAWMVECYPPKAASRTFRLLRNAGRWLSFVEALQNAPGAPSQGWPCEKGILAPVRQDRAGRAQVRHETDNVGELLSPRFV